MACARRIISWTARTWSGSVVRMKRSGAMPERVLGRREQLDHLVHERLRGLAELRGRGRDVHRVLVGPGQEERLVAVHPVPARDRVRAHDLVEGVEPGPAVGVGDRGGQVEAGSIGHRAMVAGGDGGPPRGEPPSPRRASGPAAPRDQRPVLPHGLDPLPERAELERVAGGHHKVGALAGFDRADLILQAEQLRRPGRAANAGPADGAAGPDCSSDG